MKIIDCKEIKNKQMQSLKLKVEDMPHTPYLAIVQVGDDNASDTYVNNKIKLSRELGIKCVHYKLNKNSTIEDVKFTLQPILHRHDGVILQLPLPSHLKQYEQELLDLIPVEKDVDCLSTHSIGLLHSGNASYYPCTAQAVLDVLDEYNYNLEGKRVLIIGRQQLLGYPLFRMMTDRDATVTLAHSKTIHLEDMLSDDGYDIVISAIGKPKYFNDINADFIIDVGINRDANGKLCGDIDLSDCSSMYATTVGNGYGGIGQLTVLNLMKNTIKAGGMR